MTTRILVAGILGGIVMFIWNFVAHDLLPLGEIGVHEIPNEQGVLAAMQAAIGDSRGFYLFPGSGFGPNPTREQKREAMNHMNEKFATNPSGLLVYRPQGHRFNFGRLLGVEFCTELVEAILAVVLLAQTSIGRFGCRVGFVTLVGIVAAVATNLPYWNWYGFPKDYTAAYMTMQIVGFILVGIVAALVFPKREPAAG